MPDHDDHRLPADDHQADDYDLDDDDNALANAALDLVAYVLDHLNGELDVDHLVDLAAALVLADAALQHEQHNLAQHLAAHHAAHRAARRGPPARHPLT